MNFCNEATTQEKRRTRTKRFKGFQTKETLGCGWVLPLDFRILYESHNVALFWCGESDSNEADRVSELLGVRSVVLN